MLVTRRGRYEGFFEDGLKSGRGVMEWFSGGLYLGTWQAGLMHGTGKFTSVDGKCYEVRLRGGARVGAALVWVGCPSPGSCICAVPVPCAEPVLLVRLRLALPAVLCVVGFFLVWGNALRSRRGECGCVVPGDGRGTGCATTARAWGPRCW